MSDTLPEVSTRELDVMRDTVGEDSFSMLIDNFIEDIEDHITLFQDILESRDMNMLEIKSHALKSAAYSFGATSLGNKCKAVEMATKAGMLDHVDVLTKNMITEAQKTAAYYNEEFKD
ncbi:Hpt domain-containing protein [Temperatibacter marinus]|uniref:Hpt domain-containing protein n=1 Tax=Temperatibacter marinus TaxID=1456591 RepID=A0AA52EI85_9PROT|nr:Hpt domain-containing protein [Temperatibacter marinus]WND04123.1 Hpt domain-containing protein [Temperatibacter marinus]